MKIMHKMAPRQKSIESSRGLRADGSLGADNSDGAASCIEKTPIKADSAIN
jgi:hypothetical protein